MAEPIIISGWKDIATACGVKSPKTIKKKAGRHAMPIKYIDHRPTITRKALEEWWTRLGKNPSV